MTRWFQSELDLLNLISRIWKVEMNYPSQLWSWRGKSLYHHNIWKRKKARVSYLHSCKQFVEEHTRQCVSRDNIKFFSQKRWHSDDIRAHSSPEYKLGEIITKLKKLYKKYSSLGFQLPLVNFSLSESS